MMMLPMAFACLWYMFFNQALTAPPRSTVYVARGADISLGASVRNIRSDSHSGSRDRRSFPN
jgi:hypothetical protein